MYHLLIGLILLEKELDYLLWDRQHVFQNMVRVCQNSRKLSIDLNKIIMNCLPPSPHTHIHRPQLNLDISQPELPMRQGRCHNAMTKRWRVGLYTETSSVITSRISVEAEHQCCPWFYHNLSLIHLRKKKARTLDLIITLASLFKVGGTQVLCDVTHLGKPSLLESLTLCLFYSEERRHSF